MYTVIGGKDTRAARVLWALEELGQPYDHIPEKQRSDAVRALNPSGKVPVLRDGDAVLTDSTAIMTYLSDKHGALTHKAGTLDRARQDAVTFLLLDEFDAVLWMAARHSFVLPKDMRMPAIKDSLKWEFAQSADRLAARLTGDFATGDQFTIADILCADCLSWARAAKFPLEQPVLLAYLDRMQARPAFQRVNG